MIPGLGKDLVNMKIRIEIKTNIFLKHSTYYFFLNGIWIRRIYNPFYINPRRMLKWR